MEQTTDTPPNRETAFATARAALERAHQRHIHVRQHRAMGHLTFGPYLLLQATVLPILFCGLLLLAQPYLLEFWRDFILTWAQRLDMPLVTSGPGSNGTSRLGIAWLTTDPAWGLPSARALATTAVLTLAAFGASFSMNGHLLPLKYLLRILCAVQALAVLFFWLHPESFPYGIANHINDLVSMGYSLLVAIPVMLALGYYVLNIGLGIKIVHTVLMLLYFVVFVPFQVIAHMLVLQNLSLLFMPVLYICFGALFDMLVFVALYSWAASTVPARATH